MPILFNLFGFIMYINLQDGCIDLFFVIITVYLPL